MVAVARQVAERRYRESYGRYFEDFEVDDIYEHRPGRTITETDNIQFSLLTMNQHPLHCDAAFAAKSEFGKPLVNSALTLAVMLGMSVADVSQKAIANLGWKEINLLAPVFPGDSCWAAMPDPMTNAARNALPRNSAVSRRQRATSLMSEKAPLSR